MIEIDASKESLDWSKYDLAKDEIFVIDNLFPDYIIEYVHDTLMNNYTWFYGHTSGYAEDGRDTGADPDWPEVPAFKQSIVPPQSPIASDSIWGIIYKAVMRTLPFKVDLGEVLVNGQQWIHNTTVHQDCTCDNGISFVYYVNKNWQESWGGPTRIQMGEEWVEVYPKPGRICLFKGNIPHHGMPPNETYKGLRASLVYKTMRTVPLPSRKVPTIL